MVLLVLLLAAGVWPAGLTAQSAECTGPRICEPAVDLRSAAPGPAFPGAPALSQEPGCEACPRYSRMLAAGSAVGVASWLAAYYAMGAMGMQGGDILPLSPLVPAVTVPLATHWANDRRGALVPALLASAGVYGLSYLGARQGWFVPVTAVLGAAPVFAQVLTSIWVESETD